MILSCEHADFDARKRIYCKKTGDLCGHVFFCQLSGRWKQTGQAAECPVRRETWTGKK